MNKLFKSLLLVLCVILTKKSSSQINGTVYRDYNGNGTRQNTAPYIEPGVEGIVVTAYNASDAKLNSTTTAANGTYSLAYSVPVRLEFTLPNNGLFCNINSQYEYCSYGSEGNNVRFVNASGVQNFAINNPADYNLGIANTRIFVPTIKGGTTIAGASSTQTSLVGFPYSNTGTTTVPNRTLSANNTGTIWGLAYSKPAKKMFAASFLKRHAGFKGSSGQIYLISNLESGSMSSIPFFDFDANSIPTRNNGTYGIGSSFNITVNGSTSQTISYLGGTDPISGLPSGVGIIGSNANRGLNDNNTIANNDPAAYGQIGRVGLGDIEISEDGKFLFVSNLYDRKIYRLKLNDVINPTSVTEIVAITIPLPPARYTKGGGFTTTYALANENFANGITGFQRPFALKYYRGKLYIGTTTTGENGGTSTQVNNDATPEYTDLWSYVWEYDNTTATFTNFPLLQEPLNFNRGTNGDAGLETWRVWSNTMLINNLNSDPQPMFSNIEFDETGAMILNFADRHGYQGSTTNYYLTGTTTTTNTFCFGDLYRAAKNTTSCGFQFEANATAGLITATGGVGNNGGPSNYAGSNGEFYFRDGVWNGNNGTNAGSFPYPQSNHLNTFIGGAAFLYGTANIAVSTIDPQGLWSGGVSQFYNSTGDNVADYQLYVGNANPGDPAKSAGLGDLELITPAAPIEIGNRVWNDTDGDGIQDANETGLSGVEMELTDETETTLIASVTTSTNGTYNFNSGTGTSTTGIVYGVNLQPNTNYVLRVKGIVTALNTISGNTGLSSTNYLTLSNVIGNGKIDLSDNDAQKLAGTGGSYGVTISTGNFGQNNNNIDFGFTTINILSLTIIHFTGSKQTNHNQLQWKTADENNSKEFVLERSNDGRSFNNIATVAAKGFGNGNYSYDDNTQLSGKVYYRLKMIDNDGKFTYSNIIVLSNQNNNTVSVYPNPAIDKTTLQISDNKLLNTTAKLTDMSGRIVNTILIKQNFEIIDMGKLPTGMYILKLGDGSVQKIVKK